MPYSPTVQKQISLAIENIATHLRTFKTSFNELNFEPDTPDLHQFLTYFFLLERHLTLLRNLVFFPPKDPDLKRPDDRSGRN